MKPVWIKLVDYSIANRFEYPDHELIEVNWRLIKYPKLYSTILQHEFEHKEGKYQLADFRHDMTSRTPSLFKFMMRNPSSWTQIRPLYWDDDRKQMVYDISNIFSWVVVVGIMTGVFYILRWLW